MSLTLQILLIIFTVLFFIILVKNVKKGCMTISLM